MKYFLAILLLSSAFAEEQKLLNDEDVISSEKFDEEPLAEADNAQFMMMPMGGSCGSTCACRQRCQRVWWVPCSCPPCNGCGCCNGNNTPPPPQETPPTEPPTTPTTTTEPPTTTTTCRPCQPCNGCSCSPCSVWWMCAPRCPSTCCNGGNGNCCNSPPPPPPQPCCSCPVCVPWMPCNPCRCTSNCCGNNCCSGTGCQTPDNSIPEIPPGPPALPPTLPPDDIEPLPEIIERIPEIIERIPDIINERRNPIDNRIPVERDPWDSLPPRNPRDPIYLPREPIYRPEKDPRDPIYLPPRGNRREPVYRPSVRDDRWDDDWDYRPVRSGPSRREQTRWDEDWYLLRDPREMEFFPSPNDNFRDPNFRMPNFHDDYDETPIRRPRF